MVPPSQHGEQQVREDDGLKLARKINSLAQEQDFDEAIDAVSRRRVLAGPTDTQTHSRHDPLAADEAL